VNSLAVQPDGFRQRFLLLSSSKSSILFPLSPEGMNARPAILSPRDWCLAFQGFAGDADLRLVERNGYTRFIRSA
jgi:hypothetical protein